MPYHPEISVSAYGYHLRLRVIRTLLDIVKKPEVFESLSPEDKETVSRLLNNNLDV